MLLLPHSPRARRQYPTRTHLGLHDGLANSICLPSRRVSEGVGDRQVVRIHTVNELVAHGRDGANAGLRAAIDDARETERRQELVQPVPCVFGT